MFGNFQGFYLFEDDLPIMATAAMNGDIALWDLERKQLVHVMKEAHDGSVVSMQFFNGQPILLTSGSDNAIKVRLTLFIHLNKMFIDIIC
jgi:WD40 repeat protein